MKLNNLDGITNQISSTTGAIENKVNDVQNRVQSTIGNAERGIESAQNLYNKRNRQSRGNFRQDLQHWQQQRYENFQCSGVAPSHGSGGKKAWCPAHLRLPRYEQKLHFCFLVNIAPALPVIDPQKRDVRTFQKVNQEGKTALSYLSPGGAGSLLSKGWDTLTDRDSAEVRSTRLCVGGKLAWNPR
ncbi:hypothetical protein N5V81_13000 [Escherichia coli]|nr:hypothetical protein [Escherichia coli]